MEWVRGDLIGHGSFGTVNLAIPRTNFSPIPPLMAVKSCGVSHSASLVKEKSILEELNGCPQIVRCLGDDSSCENGEELYNVFLQYASGGALADEVRNSGGNLLPESDVRRYTKSILKGIRHIHGKGYVHCDIKLQNILLFSDEEEEGENCSERIAKIADFGLAKKSGEKLLGFELRGTPLYMSPETVVGGVQESPADIWALGCAVAEMAAGAPAWRCRPECGIGELLLRIGIGEEVPEIPGKLSEEGKDFLGKCFVKDPRKRWTAEMLLDHPFVADHDGDRETFPSKAPIGEESPSTSPRCPFDFPDWLSVQSSVTCSITSLPSPKPLPESESLCPDSPAERLRRLLTEQRSDWSFTGSWVTVRQ